MESFIHQNGNTMMSNYTKKQRREIRELIPTVHERDLGNNIAELDKDFEKWRNKEIDAFDLNEKIHQFHQGPSRNLFIEYNSRHHQDHMIARGLMNGLVEESEISTELKLALKPVIELLGSFDE